MAMARDKSTLRFNEELHRVILESMIDGKRGRGRPRTRYTSQIIEDARVDSCEHLEDITQNGESLRENL